MTQKCRNVLFTTALATLAPMLLALLPGADAQYQRNLPKAGFVSRAGSLGNSNLPVVNGVHLTDGQEEPRNGKLQPYNPGEPSLNWQLVRWESKKMPLKVWVSPGIQLPPCPFSELQKTRVDMVTEMLTTLENPFMGCTQAVGWTPQVNDVVLASLEEWRPFEKEGLFSWVYTDDPRQAEILIFFVDNFKDATAPGGITVGGNTCAQIYPFKQAQTMKIRQKPVIIELSTMVNPEPDKMYGASAHEFGHALGIKAHSPYRYDIMNENRVVQHLSARDKMTIRQLYHVQPQWVM